MQYVLLKTVYHKDRAKYRALYEKRFQGEETVHLPITIGESPAFYCITGELLDIVYDIAMLNTRIFQIDAELPPIAREQFISSCLINEVAMTNRIEGIHSSRKEIGELLEGIRGTKNEDTLLGLILKYGRLISGDHDRIQCCRDIRNLFDDLVAKEVVGENPNEMPDGAIFRKDSVSIYTESQKEIHVGLYPEEKIIAAMETAIGILNDQSQNKLIRIALFHYLFGYIHPFYNGNGRVNRFISSAQLAQELTPYICFQLSQTIKNNTKKYYDAFQFCNHPLNKGDLTPFLIMFLKLVKGAAMEIKESLEQKYGDLKHYSLALQELPLGKQEVVFLSVVIQATLFSSDGRGITNKELTEHLSISRTTISHRVERIRSLGEYILTDYSGKVKYYKANLELLDQALS